MKASDVIERAYAILQDEDQDFWPQAELMQMWLADGRLEALRLRPDLFSANEAFACELGPLQHLPNRSRHLFEVVCNLSAPSRRQVTVVDPLVLARHRPAWRSMLPAEEIRHFVYDERAPGQFEVFPPAAAGTVLEIRYAKPPETSIEADTEMAQEGDHAPALVDYVLYRAFLKEADTVPAFHQRAVLHLQACHATLTDAVQAKAATSPNQ